jgi:uncharacterized YigZ family protein
MSNGYFIPVGRKQIELVIQRSRFIATATYTPTVQAAKAFIAEISQTYPDASHHVYAFAVGHGASVTHGMSDAGEPAGTAGKPTLAVVKGSGLGDVTVVTTRYFGGTKLGTGGLVKAYTEAAQLALTEIPRVEKVEKRAVTFVVPYHLYERVIRLISHYEGEIQSEDFAAEVTLKLVLPDIHFQQFAADLAEISSGRIILDQEET